MRIEEADFLRAFNLLIAPIPMSECAGKRTGAVVSPRASPVRLVLILEVFKFHKNLSRESACQRTLSYYSVYAFDKRRHPLNNMCCDSLWEFVAVMYLISHPTALSKFISLILSASST